MRMKLLGIKGEHHDMVDMACRFVHEGLDGTELVPKPALRAPVSALNSIAQLCNLLDLHLKPAAAAGAQLLAAGSGLSPPRSQAGHTALGSLLEDIFIFCSVWSIGAVMLERDQGRFVTMLKQLAGMEEKPGPEVAAGSVPAGSLYEYRFDVEAGAWKVSRELSHPNCICTMNLRIHACVGIGCTGCFRIAFNVLVSS